eukprot:TRINITY_DN35687_c0_g1_i1.p1 TRINITY_DN35687_c0_g1~~TRINITY_DN35687_c0_g1_i1.p1  ORF type:complete len:290 (+),score=50.84 TRINITY_DN35687_c0_g1_i1:87-872(+)
MDRVPFFGCINLIERDDRFKHMKSEFARVGLKDRVHWHRPRKHPEGGRVGCFESHLALFKAALDQGANFAVVCEDDLQFSSKWRESIERVLALIDSGVKWNYISMMNSGGEVLLHRPGDENLPKDVRRGGFYFTRCYAISKPAMERALEKGISKAHVDVSLAVANWGTSFIVRPAAVLDVPFESDNDWGEGGCAPWCAGKMQGYTHLPCVISDRWKLDVQPRFSSVDKLELTAWKDKFMLEPGALEHLPPGASPETPPVGN